MTDKVGEQLSAWMDGELPEEEVPLLLKRLEEDRELRLRLQRFQMIRDAMKGGLPDMIDYGMADQVKAEIDGESIPFRKEVEEKTRAGKRWLKPVAGAAIAASVAVVAVIGIQVMSTPPESSLPSLQQQAATQTMVAPQPVQRASYGNDWEVSDPEVARRLNDLLIIHSEHAAVSAVQSVPPQVRIVGFESQE
ncbi:MAG: hypothetical protein Kow006_32200 [Gammaproteobacteria bacterium]